MIQDKRKSKRKAINRHATIQLAGGTPPLQCLVTDVSDGGVRLQVEGIEVPDRFALVLADGRPRDCKVVWRLGCELGASFLDTFSRDEQPDAADRQPAA